MTLRPGKSLRVPEIWLYIFGAVCLFCSSATAQTDNNKRGRNNPYSPSPTQRTKPDLSAKMTGGSRPDPNAAAFIIQRAGSDETDNRPTIAQRTNNIAKETGVRGMRPTETYKVAVGDVLLVKLKNAAQGSGYYTVRKNGSVDFPLAGEDVMVADRTIDDIEEMLASRITLYPDPQVEVKIREYGSHRVTVSGLVDNPGDKHLQREAIPLYVLRAEAITDPRATKALITRALQGKLETYCLSDPGTDPILVYPGDSIEFAADSNSRSNIGVYFISGDVRSPGQKDLTNGLTLYQAITASGGAKGTPKKATVRRKNDAGLLSVLSYDVRTIRDGKAMDPLLVTGDVIEIKN